MRALAWTTTPWTLPTNLALAVGPQIEYSVVPAGPLGAGDASTGAEQGQLGYLLATDTIAAHAKDLGYATPAEAQAAADRARSSGTELAGISYQRLWDYYADTDMWGTENAWQILLADYVDHRGGHRDRAPGARHTAKTTRSPARPPASPLSSRSMRAGGSCR